MTLLEFHDGYARSEIMVMSAFDGKVLCKAFDPKKHNKYANREIISIWADVRLSSGISYGNWVKPIICVYVDGKEEADKYFAKRKEQT